MCFCWQPCECDWSGLQAPWTWLWPKGWDGRNYQVEPCSQKVRQEGILVIHKCETWADRGRPAGHRICSVTLQALGKTEEGKMIAVVLFWSSVKCQLAGGQTCSLWPQEDRPSLEGGRQLKPTQLHGRSGAFTAQMVLVDLCWFIAAVICKPVSCHALRPPMFLPCCALIDLTFLFT